MNDHHVALLSTLVCALLLAPPTQAADPADVVAEACTAREILAKAYRPAPSEITMALEKLQPGLDLARYRAVEDELRALGGDRAGCAPSGFELTIPKAQRSNARALTDELAAQLKLLRAAAKIHWGNEPRAHWRVVIADTPGYRQTFYFDEKDPRAWAGLLGQDGGIQSADGAAELAGLSKFANLAVMHLFGNGLTGLVFDCSKLKKLRVLDLAQNDLKKVPPSLLSCPNLEWLDLSENPLWVFPTEVGELTSLRFLGLNGTNLDDFTLEEVRKALPNTVVETTRRVYTAREKTMNLVLMAAGISLLADGTVSNAKGSLPRGRGEHLVGGVADLPAGKKQQVVVAIDAASGAQRVHWRGPDGGWSDVTRQAKRVKPARKLAAK